MGLSHADSVPSGPHVRILSQPSNTNLETTSIVLYIGHTAPTHTPPRRPRPSRLWGREGRSDLHDVDEWEAVSLSLSLVSTHDVTTTHERVGSFETQAWDGIHCSA